MILKGVYTSVIIVSDLNNFYFLKLTKVVVFRGEWRRRCGRRHVVRSSDWWCIRRFAWKQTVIIVIPETFAKKGETAEKFYRFSSKSSKITIFKILFWSLPKNLLSGLGSNFCKTTTELRAVPGKMNVKWLCWNL